MVDIPIANTPYDTVQAVTGMICLIYHHRSFKSNNLLFLCIFRNNLLPFCQLVNDEPTASDTAYQ